MRHEENLDCDLLIVGSGAAGLAAAVVGNARGLNVIVCERASALGGASALSGGEIWIPMSRQAAGKGEDSTDDALAYLKSAVGPNLDAARARAFVENCHRALAFLEDNSRLRYELLDEAVDYRNDLATARSGLRTLGAIPFDGRLLGPHFETIRRPLPISQLLGGMSVGRKDLPHLARVTRSIGSAIHVSRMLATYGVDRLVGRSRGTRLVMGNALVASLALTLIERRVPLLLGCDVSELRRDRGRVSGAVATSGDNTIRIDARRGVILATGGFSGSDSRRREFFAHVQAGAEHRSPLPPTNDGSALSLAIRCGGVIDPIPSDAGAWTPMSEVPLRDGSRVLFPHFGDRAKPGVIAVDSSGRRFANEAANYHDFGKQMLKVLAQRPGSRFYLMTTHGFLRKYGLGRVPPSPAPFRAYVERGYLIRGDSVRALAEQLDIAPASLEATVTTFDAAARSGSDPEFRKGESQFEVAAGDPMQLPNACVAPLGAGPFYAVRMFPGDIGTTTGLLVDERARVLDADRRSIPGLYAIGTASSSLMRDTYPAAGIMLGPALTTAYVAVLDAIAEHSSSRASSLPAQVQ